MRLALVTRSDRGREKEAGDEGGSHSPASIHPPRRTLRLSRRVPHCLVLTRAPWLSLGPVTPSGRQEDHNGDQGRTWRRAVPSRKTDKQRERERKCERWCLKEAAGISSDGFCSLELVLKLDRGSAQMKKKRSAPVLQLALRHYLTTSQDEF